ncbi:ABC transporter ATP-binding protein [Geosporobacter ferrireducens]|uniref:ABC-type quaternary amine transporter n=1 Tax=Geosporobacter ferrireducens TaxID=1424294 RepID=A0A1D8GEU3_9FIRM|nr:ABC transporter ATP-binding protein [Geosporobacter ferrireducens]AOT69431.1 ABC transporter ATP-binding protein [Geosporobacter ferrireducens]
MSYFYGEKLSKNFDNLKVFEDLGFEIEKGELITLLGPSGCGKSTLLRCIAGLTEVDSGCLYIGNQEITNLSPKDRNIGMVFQSYALFPNMTVAENIAFALKITKKTKAEINRKIKDILALIELEEKENHYPRQLSGGQQQRVALARALVTEPKVLLLDEPLSALDAKIRKNLRYQIRKIQKELNITTIFVTHDQEEALILSDRIFLMNNGQFSQIGTPEEIYTSPKNEFAARFMGNYNVFNKDELEKIIKSAFNMHGNIFAIRPEAICMSKDEILASKREGILFEGKIVDIIILGNVIRYHITCDNHTVITDVLNNGKLIDFKEGNMTELLIPWDEIKSLA